MQTNSNPESNKGISKTLTDINGSLGKGLTESNTARPGLKVSSQKSQADLSSHCLVSYPTHNIKLLKTRFM